MESHMILGIQNTLAFCMLFTVLAVTAEAPVAVPPFFLKIMRRFKEYRQSNKNKPKEKSSEKFWEIDMTKFEP